MTKLADSPMAEIVAITAVKSSDAATSANLNGDEASGRPSTKAVKGKKRAVRSHLRYLYPQLHSEKAKLYQGFKTRLDREQD